MRILHLVSYPLFSGPVPPTLGLALAQRRLGHTVWLAFDRIRGNFNGYEEAAEPRVAPHGITPPIDLCLSAKASPWQQVRDAQALGSWLRRGEVDVVHTHLSHDHALSALALVGRSHAQPLVRVRTVHAARSLSPRTGQRWLMRRADAWIARCARHRDALVHTFELSPGRTVCVPGGIDAAAWDVSGVDKVRARARFGVPSNVALVGQVALLAGRGQEALLDAVHTLGSSAPHVLLVGDGEAQAALRARVARLQLTGRVHFTGYLDTEALRTAYAAMDVAFLAQAGNDASVRAALEAMSAGLPVIGVQVDALGELVHGGVGYAVQRATAKDIAQALRTWLCDERASVKGGRARDEVRVRRTFDAEARATEAVYIRAFAPA